ncbi:MAG: AMP-binding protein [Planctomycetaceae bacterium]|nr:AMP-binding protein [Planctomycetaceae bacterium]
MPLNIAQRLSESAALNPHQQAVVFPEGRDRSGRVTYSQMTFQQLDDESDRLAAGLRSMGVQQGTRLVLMVRPSLEFVALTFALFKAGVVVVLIDPGMGRSNIFRCLAEVEPEGFVAIPIVHVIRCVKRKLFPLARFNVTVGRRWGWGGLTYEELNTLGEGSIDQFQIAATEANDPAAIIFTSGSTGPPKGVLYEHGMFNAQVDALRDFYQIQPGEVDLPGFPLFALFNAAMGVTTVIPDMDPTRPADVDPRLLIEAIRDQGVTQAFGSPALWNRVGRYCEEHRITLPSLRRALSAGAPVPNHVLQRMGKVLSREGADIHTPFGATAPLPVCSISGGEVLGQTAAKTRAGAGTCVGTPFSTVSVKIIEAIGEAVASLNAARELPTGEIGEIIVSSPSTTREYFRRTEATAMAKIPDSDRFWHRMGDVGYFDEQGRLWFCGRKAHIVETEQGPMFTIRCEAIINDHPQVYRSALVGIGDKPSQRPVIVVEPEPDQFPESAAERERFTIELKQLAAANPLTEQIDTILFHKSLPVDIRHNVKIFREKLAVWATGELGGSRGRHNAR